MKEFFSKNWRKVLYVVVAVVVLVLCFFRPFAFKCSADSIYTQHYDASSWGISKSSSTKLFEYLDFEGFDKYLVETLKVPSYSYGNFKFNLDIVVQVALYSGYQEFFESEWEKVEAGMLDRRDVIKFGNFDVPSVVYDCEYLGLEPSQYDGIKFVYHVSNNQGYTDSRNYNILNFKLSLNWGQTFNKEYKYVDVINYPKVRIIYNLTGVSSVTSNPATVYKNQQNVQLTFTLNDGYSWVDSTVSVTGATYTFYQDTGTIVLHTIKESQITVNITATAVQTEETWVFNNTLYGDSFQIDINFYFYSSSGLKRRYTTIMWDVSAKKLWFMKTGLSESVYDSGEWKPYISDRTVTFSIPPTGDLLTWLQSNAVKQTSGDGHSGANPQSFDIPVAPYLPEIGSTEVVPDPDPSTDDNVQIAAYRDNNYIIDIRPFFSSIANRFVSYEEYPIGFRLSSLEASYSGASRPLWTPLASGTAPDAYMITLNTMMSYLQYYGRNLPVSGTLAWTCYFVSGDTYLYSTYNQNIGQNSRLIDTFRIRADAFTGTAKSFSLYSYKIQLTGEGKDSYGTYAETIPTYGRYELFNYYKEGAPESCDNYIYNSEFYPMITDNFGASFGGGSGNIEGYDYNSFYMPLDDFNFFDLFKGSTWYAIINNSVVWLCCEMPLLSNLTRPLYTAARLSGNFLGQYILPFFTSTGMIGAAVGFIILISNLWRWIKRDD